MQTGKKAVSILSPQKKLLKLFLNSRETFLRTVGLCAYSATFLLMQQLLVLTVQTCASMLRKWQKKRESNAGASGAARQGMLWKGINPSSSVRLGSMSRNTKLPEAKNFL